MFNPFQMMKNPIQAIQNQMLARMQSQNPQLFQKVQEMMKGKNDVELREMANNIANERGINLSEFASQFGIKL